jgi:stress-induced morphogen
MHISLSQNSVTLTITEPNRTSHVHNYFFNSGAYDDPNGSHIKIEVVSTMFEGKRAMQRQQLVYKAIWEEMQGAVHAVDSMVCKTPDEA